MDENIKTKATPCNVSMDRIRIAYLILAHKNPEQLKRLIQRLQSRNVSYWIHIDRRVDMGIFRRSLNDLRPSIPIEWVDRASPCWGSFGMTQATLNGLRQITGQKFPFDYVILLSGQDYPIQTMDKIEQFFEEHDGRSFLNSDRLPCNAWESGGMDRIQRYHFFVYGRHVPVPFRRGKNNLLFRILNNCLSLVYPMPRIFPAGLAPFGGSSWWCLHKAAIDYILGYLEERPDVMKYFKTVLSPDEILPHTVLMNSPLAETVINDDLRYVEWRRPQPPYPAILVGEDFDSIKSSNRLFARKFDPDVDENILDLIDRKIIDGENVHANG
jgi:hypothetical protein